jgi:glucose-1-phosphate cytidylyltransferase
MKAVILAGGLGTRLSEETGARPKPMVEIGEQPILWHILKIYSTYGINDFIICCGYKGHIIKEYFRDYMLRTSSTTFDFRSGDIVYHDEAVEPWRITLVETGLDSMTGGRLKRAREYIGNETFCMTYGDGVSDVDIGSLLAFHRAHGKLATLTAVQPPGRFGVFSLSEHDPVVHSFTEKPQGDGSWINGGFFVLDPGAIDYIDGDDTVWEQAPMRQLANDGELVAYRHDGFWQPMDSLRDKSVLEGLWAGGSAPWRVWETDGRRPVPELNVIPIARTE